ncbi:hypothetical protein TSOC_001719 [Tetrabaena socialis]|uniref:Programmed cell death protein 2 C-terminal domain-containing protein n=1 Tax=Tetrabaena socialis TaxID=47790 RepID=A0A2J8AG34_9CHLO|nr:hypothetical protein TSOC_001719 [Tetrabaena socialis]|eukprot:PNH11466.1 hypothetical protein TSOC_001719 [Tetrabaena socialis]
MAPGREAPVLLGIAGDCLTADEPRSHYLTKVGGAPWVPQDASYGAAGPLCEDGGWRASTLCGACGRPMSLVMQAYAPLAAKPPPQGPAHAPCQERVLLVLGCAHPGCGTAPGSWRAFRWQLSRSTGAPEPASGAPAPAPAGSTAAGAAVGAAAAATGGVDAPAVAPLGGGQADGDDPFAGGFEPDSFACGVEPDPFAGGFDAAADPFGASGSGAGGELGGKGPGGGGGLELDFSDLGAVLEECAAKQAQQAQHDRGSERRSAPQQQAAEPVPSVELPLRGPPLPEFHIFGVEEPAGKGKQGRRGEQDHVQRLLEEYQRQEQGGAGSGRAPAQPGPNPPARGGPAPESISACSTASQPARGTPGRAANESRQESAQAASLQPGQGGSEDSGDDDEEGAGEGGVARGGGGAGRGGSAAAAGPDGGASEGECWAGEEYEEDHVRGVEGAYLKFAARLARQPGQCARYGRNCPVLWPQQASPKPPPCSRCGAPRVFELQLMAPLIAIVLDCAGWLEGAELQRHTPAINAAANWNLATVAVYTCSANCCGMGGRVGQREALCGAGGEAAEGAGGGPVVEVMEEFAALLNEEQCHVVEELRLGK